MSAPASLASAALAQTRVELRLTARRGENLLAMVGVPVVVLLFFGNTDIIRAAPGASRLDTLLPGTLALAMIATGLVNLGIATAYERTYGVLKRLGGSPLGRSGLVIAKLAAVLAVEAAQVVALIVLAWLVFGWRPGADTSWLEVPLVLLVGTATFVGLGLALAGSLRAEATLTLANALFLVFLLLGGLIVPADQLPGPLATVSGLLPASALADAWRAVLGGGGDLARPMVILAIWAVVAVGVTIRSFRWE